LIAVDTSSLRRFLSGDRGPDVESVGFLIRGRQMVLPPVVLTEILSEPTLQAATADALAGVPLLPLLDGYWARAGRLRAKALAAGHKSKVADALVAQSCLDHEVALITNDRDFRHYTKWGLRLA
jgi:predicted nucleic acid-binding protein